MEDVNTRQYCPTDLIQPRRKITGMSAILLPFTVASEIDWVAFENQVSRTIEAGLIPAVNMDTGFANLIDDSTRIRVLDTTRDVVAGSEFVAGAFISDQPDSAFDLESYSIQLDQIQQRNGLPIIFQSYGLAHQTDDKIIENYNGLTSVTDRFLAFELGEMFAAFGRIYSLNVYRQLMQIRQCVGAKHSSLDRGLEWERLMARDALRPEFQVLTGNDLAIDMVMYGSDYLLGLSTFCPDVFAKRDALWLDGDSAFYQLNDVLQYLGSFAFRSPTAAYKHSAAMFLKLRGWISSDTTHPKSPRRPESDRDILAGICDLLALEVTES